MTTATPTRRPRPARRPSVPAPRHGPAAQRALAALVGLALAGGVLAGSITSADSASAAPTRGGAAAGAPAATATATATAGAPSSPVAPAAGSFTLHVGAALRSPDGSHRLVVSDYGDLILIGPGGAVVWHSETAGEHDASASLLDDGDLVLRSKGGRLLWHTGTNGYGPSTLAVTDDGRVVLTSSRGVSWTSTGAVPRAHGGVSQVDPLGARIATWAAAQSFAGSSGCNPYSFLVGARSVGCPTGQARRAWNLDFAEAASRSADAVTSGVRCAPGSARCAPQPGDEAVFQLLDGRPARLGVVTEVNSSTRMMRLALDDVDGAVQHVWLPVTGGVVDGRPLYRVASPRTS